MAIMSEHHKTMTDGKGKCSVPMWSGGCPAGFCDKDAFGEPPPGKTHCRPDGYLYRDDGRYAGYVPGLACEHHGGPCKTQ